MELTKLSVKLTFTEPVLGTSPKNPNLYRDYVGSNAPDAGTLEDEIASLGVDEVTTKGMTGFPRMEDGRPFFYDYQIKGFFKDCCGGLRKIAGSRSGKVKAYKKEIDRLIFVQPRKIPLEFSGELGECQRPLRAQTMQGERVSLAISEEAPAGTVIRFDILLLDAGQADLVREWLDYGALSGIGQWRNSGKGRFVWEAVE